MYKIIGENNKVRYGCIDEPVDWNYQDFKLKNFFDKEIKGLKKKCAYHQFNYVGITAGDYIVGFATVDLTYLRDVFAFLYDTKTGVVFEMDQKTPGFSKALKYPRNPDNYVTTYKKGKTSILVDKSHNEGRMILDCDFKGRLKFSGEFDFAIDTHNPLRVLNPSLPTRFTYTEKCSPLRPRNFKLSFDGKDLDFDEEKVVAIYDWSGGYLRRETNWYWTAFGAVLDDDTTIGVNFASLVNETYFSENAFWINNQRTRPSRIIYDFNESNPYEPWHIYDEAGTVDIIFRPQGERNDRVNGGPFGKTVFRQFVGTLEGYLKPEDGQKVEFSGIKGFCETHRAMW